MAAEGNLLFFSSRIWPLVKGRGDGFTIGYHEAALTSMASPAGSGQEVVLPSGRRLSAVRKQVAEFSLLNEMDIDAIVNGNEAVISDNLRYYEIIPSGLADYF